MDLEHQVDKARKRILFLAEGATMAHFVRLLALADTLDASEYDIHFYAPARFAGYLRGKPFSTGELATMPGEQFLANLSKGAPMFPASVLRDYVLRDRELLQHLRPDLTIGDLRLSLSLSAKLESARCAVMMNAYWSLYTKRRSIIPQIPLTRIVPPRFLGPIYKLTEPLAFARHVAPLNSVRKELGFPPIPADIRAMYTDGDYVLYPDVPEFVPAIDLPANHFYLGTCQWKPAAELPDWWHRMLNDPKPKVFIALGSSGSSQVCPALFRALAKLPVSIVISTSGRKQPGITPAMYSADLLPLAETALQARLVISHGGSPGVYPAMSAGKPVLAIPSNADQHISAAVLVENGAGLGVRVEEASEGRLSEALEKLLFDPKYTRSAQRWSEVFARYDSKEMFRAFLDQIL